jgi:hypothetical protein
MTTDETPPTAKEEKPRFLDNPRNVKGILWGFLVLCLAVVGYEIYRPLGGASGGVSGDEAEAVHHLAERAGALEFVGSFALYGFVSCVALVVLGKGLRRLAMRPEDYYDPEPTEPDEPTPTSDEAH